MRRRGVLLVSSLVAAAITMALWQWRGAGPTRAAHSSAAWKLELSREATVSLVYEVDGDGLRFSLPPGTERVKLLTQVRYPQPEVLRAQQAADPARRWSYALEITLHDDEGQVLRQRAHHVRSKFTEWSDSAGRRFTAEYFLEGAAAISDSALLHVDLAGLPPVAAIRLRRLSLAPEADTMLARVYAPERISDRQLGILWQRLHERQKNALARASAYPAPELLLEDEKRNLLRNRWHPLAPLGVSGIDFQLRKLYVLRELEGERLGAESVAAGRVLGPARRVTVPIAEGGGSFRFVFEALDPEAGDAPVQLDWYGPGVFDRSGLSIRGSGRIFEWAGPLAGGLVELASAQDFAARVFQVAPVPAEITPQAIYARTFVASGDRGVAYAVAHDSDAPTPVRATLRALLVPGEARSRSARYRIRDRAGAVLAEGDLPFDNAPSLYDALVDEPGGTAVSEPREYFFSLPPAAVNLEFMAGDSGVLLVSLYSRPPGMSRVSRVPEDLYEFTLRGERLPAWFGVRPEDYERRVLEYRSRLLAVQPRPRQVDGALLRGDFQWHEYRPQGDWLARVVFSARDDSGPMREDALPSTFSPLPANRTVRLIFPAYHGQSAVRPTLAWLAEAANARELRLSVRVDGAARQQVRARGAFGEERLLPVRVGEHRIRVEAPAGVRLYVNHVPPGPGARVQRLAQRLRGPLRFEYRRDTTDEEFLAARLFQAGSLGERRTRLAIRIEVPPPPTLVPLPYWLFERREADVRADRRDQSPIFNTAGERVDAGQPVLIPFPEGTPAGRYRIEIEALPGERADELYLALSRVAAQPQARGRLHLEPTVTHAPP